MILRGVRMEIRRTPLGRALLRGAVLPAALVLMVGVQSASAFTFRAWLPLHAQRSSLTSLSSTCHIRAHRSPRQQSVCRGERWARM